MTETIELRNGELAFTAEACGPREGRVVLCLHGFPDHARTFRSQLPALARAGYRAVAPSLRGYQPSSQPADGDYSLAALAGDVVAWIDSLGAERVHLFGHDWGAAIGYLAAALAPERLLSLTTLAVPPSARLVHAIRHVPSQLRKSWYIAFFQLRGVADWAISRDDWSLVRRLWSDWSPGFELAAEEWKALHHTLEAPGVKHAVLAYYRQNLSPFVLLRPRQSAALSHTTVPVRTLAITGANDGCMDTRLHDHAFPPEDFPRGVRVERLAGVGHFAHQEAPGRVNRLLLDWLEEAS